eukprot:CAMPEP_0116034130 /NCGR_PEP_ID=MMETSP0321-20121206/19416_1 /TAXON_ID=163516 /ORGANISM="Leptocylindrus danicus var. danicus, Strain B650" /LENGTH=430 /DNA_ID=CAMNT_0003510367 /DNA_START=332 /DNA_END=1625 /DNA_ORIENTATION=+
MPKYLDEKDYSVSLPINNGKEEHGKCLVIDFESDLFIGTVLLRIKEVPKPESASRCDTNDNNYFKGRKRTFQAIVQGCFKRDDVPMSECITGQTFEKPASHLPPGFILKPTLNLFRVLAPQLQVQFGEKPVFVSPLAATAQTIVSIPKLEEKGKASDKADERLKLGQNSVQEKEGVEIVELSSFRKLMRRLSGEDITPIDVADDPANSSASTEISDDLLQENNREESEPSSPNTNTNDGTEDENVGVVVKVVRRLSSNLSIIVDDAAHAYLGTDYSDSESEGGENGDQTSFLPCSGRNNFVLEDSVDEPSGTASILNEIPGHKVNHSKASGRLKERKKVFNELFAKRLKHKTKGPTFSTKKEYRFEFFQHLLLFDDFSLKLPFFNPKLAGTLNGQPLQFMAGHQKDPSEHIFKWLWSFEIWHESLLEPNA